MANQSFRVKVDQGPSAGKKYTIKRQALVMGSSEEADVVFPVEGVSPLHAQIVFQGGQVQLEDLGSQEGTFRNGRQLLGPVQLFPGDRIGLGPNVILTLEGPDPEAEQASDDEQATDLGLASQDAAES